MKNSAFILTGLFITLLVGIKTAYAIQYQCKPTKMLSTSVSRKFMSKTIDIKAEIDRIEKPVIKIDIKDKTMKIKGNYGQTKTANVGANHQYIEYNRNGDAFLWSFFPAGENHFKKNVLVQHKTFNNLGSPLSFTYFYFCKNI